MKSKIAIQYLVWLPLPIISASCCCRMELIDSCKSRCGRLFQALTMSRRSSARYFRLGNLRSLWLILVHPVLVVIRWHPTKLASFYDCDQIWWYMYQHSALLHAIWQLQTFSYCLCTYTPSMIFDDLRGSSYSCFCSVCHMRSNYILILISFGNYVLGDLFMSVTFPVKVTYWTLQPPKINITDNSMKIFILNYVFQVFR